MREHPMIFTAESVRAILAGRKTQTRRVLKNQPVRQDVYPKRLPDGRWNWCLTETGVGAPSAWRTYRPGDLIWVRETWCPALIVGANVEVAYRADGNDPNEASAQHRVLEGAALEQARRALRHGDWRPPIYMPRWASRITLRVTDVRVQRLQEISAVDCWAEGIQPMRKVPGVKVAECVDIDRNGFAALWDSINAKRGHPWGSNPWVAAYTFERQ